MEKRRKTRGRAPLRATTQAASWETFSKWIDAHSRIDWIFRGVSDQNYKLIPKIGRPETRTKGSGYLPQHEKLLLDEFQRMAPAYLPLGTQLKSGWDWLALAQHHGLPTRLLDWSLSPLVAAYFAVENDGKNSDAAIYAYKPVQKVVPGDNDPFMYHGVIRFDPPNISPRIVAQAAIFTLHPHPTRPLKPRMKRLRRLIIAEQFRKGLKGRLNNLGVNRASLFPDLDGVSTYLTWLNKIIVDQIDYPFQRPVIEIEGTARKLFEEHGAIAPDIVRSQIEQVRDAGDMENAAIYRRVLKAVEKLLAQEGLPTHLLAASGAIEPVPFEGMDDTKGAKKDNENK